MAPKKNRKPCKNGYWQFVIECRNKAQNPHMSKDFEALCSQKWNSMNDAERRPYKDKVQLGASSSNSPTKPRYTTDGIEIDKLEREEKEKSTRVRLMKEDINRTLKEARYAQTLGDQVFLIIHINHLVHYPANDKYFVCEVAIAAVSLTNGIERVFHEVVQPGKLPIGFYGPASAHSKETHQMIELVQDEPFRDNTRQVFTNIVTFIKYFATGTNLPILYCDEKTFEMTNKVFENWRQEFRFEKDIVIYDFLYLFYALRNAVAQKQFWENVTFSHAVVERDVYSYTPNISCDFHELSDISVHCSKSIVTRYGFMLCDHCCGDLGIELRAGAHVPDKSRVEEESQKAAEPAAVYGSKCFRLYQPAIYSPR